MTDSLDILPARHCVLRLADFTHGLDVHRLAAQSLGRQNLVDELAILPIGGLGSLRDSGLFGSRRRSLSYLLRGCLGLVSLFAGKLVKETKRVINLLACGLLCHGRRLLSSRFLGCGLLRRGLFSSRFLCRGLLGCGLFSSRLLGRRLFRRRLLGRRFLSRRLFGSRFFHRRLLGCRFLGCGLLGSRRRSRLLSRWRGFLSSGLLSRWLGRGGFTLEIGQQVVKVILSIHALCERNESDDRRQRDIFP